MEIMCQSQCRNALSSEIGDITHCNRISCAKCALSFGWKSFVSHNVETHSSEIGDIRAAIESVAPSVHCRSDGNHLSVTMSRNTPSSEIGDLPTAIESVAVKRALSFGWKSFVSHNVETPSSEIGDIPTAIESVAPSVRCRSDGDH
jgi:hypothetical protein